jgi:hypothetical protein
MVRAGTPAYLMLIDGLIQSYPDHKQLLTAACQAYASYASAFLEDTDPATAARLYGKAKDYGFRALSSRRDFQQARWGTLEEFAVFLGEYERQDVPALFWTATSWAGWIKLNPDDLEALADLPIFEATLRRVLELDEAYHYGGPHILMAVYLAARPAIIGGDLDKARVHFHRAIALGEGKLHMAKVLLAQYYAVPVRDKNLFEQILQEVVASPVDEVEELTLSNALAKEKAEKLLEKMDECFIEIP